MKHYKIHLFAGAMSFIMAFTTAAQGQDQVHKPTTPKEFVKNALEANQAEVQAAKLAQRKSRSPAVQQLGETIAQDNEKVRNKLVEMAAKYNVQAGEQTATGKHQSTLDKLRQLEGAEFDQAFLEQMINDHQQDLKMLERSSKDFSNEPALKQLVDNNLPIVKRHLAMAQAAQQNRKAAVSDNSRTVRNRPDLNPGQNNALETREGDGEVLGLPTSNKDGTIAGIIPAPSGNVRAGSTKSYIAEELADGKVDKGVDSVTDANTTAVGAPGVLERSSGAAAYVAERDLPANVRRALKNQGVEPAEQTIKRVTVYEVDINGQKMHATSDGKIYKADAQK